MEAKCVYLLVHGFDYDIDNGETAEGFVSTSGEDD